MVAFKIFCLCALIKDVCVKVEFLQKKMSNFNDNIVRRQGIILPILWYSKKWYLAYQRGISLNNAGMYNQSSITLTC